MSGVKKILHITPDFNYSCGRSKLVFLHLKYFTSKNEYETHFITNGGDSLDRLDDVPSVKFIKLSFSTGLKNIFYYSLFYRNLKKYILENKIQLVHTHHRFPEIVSSKVAGELNFKTITTAHSFVNGYKSISFRSDKIIAVSNVVASSLFEDYKVNPEKVITLYNPVKNMAILNENEKQKIKSKFSIISNKKVLLFMGRIDLEKGYDKLIKAYRILYERNNSLVLIMCGQIEEKKFESLRNELKVPIIVIPPVKDVNKLYEISDIIILPSRIDPFPFVMLEAGMKKKPFLGSNTGGISEFIENGVNGVLINPEDEKELADKILYLLQNKEIADEMGNNLYKKVKEKCDYQNYFSKVEEIYDSLLS